MSEIDDQIWVMIGVGGFVTLLWLVFATIWNTIELFNIDSEDKFCPECGELIEDESDLCVDCEIGMMQADNAQVDISANIEA